MSATTVFVELLIIGLETLLWLFLLISSLFGISWVSEIAHAFEKAQSLATLCVVGLAYVIGIVADEVCETLIDPWTKQIRKKVYSEGKLDIWEIQSYVVARSQSAVTQLGYMRSRLRILRFSLINLILIVLFALIFLGTQSNISNNTASTLSWSIIISGPIFLGCTMLAYKRIEAGYWLKTLSFYNSLKMAQKTNSVTE